MEKKRGHKTSTSDNVKQRPSHQHSTNGDVKDKPDILDIMHHERLEREKIVLWRKPLKTIHYSCLESASLLNLAGRR
jgi:hypothetical protein